jgi:hypothetical protein
MVHESLAGLICAQLLITSGLHSLAFGSFALRVMRRWSLRLHTQPRALVRGALASRKPFWEIGCRRWIVRAFVPGRAG